MDFFTKNQNYLKKTRVTVFADDNKKAFETENDAIYKKEDGHYLAERENVKCFIQSKYSVTHEVESMFSDASRSAECIVLFGCGCGDAIRYALDSGNFPVLESLVIFEPSPAWAAIVMNEMDMEKTWGPNAEKIAFFVGYHPDDIGKIIAEGSIILQEDFFMANHLSVRTVFFEYYQELIASMKSNLQNIKIRINTNKTMTPLKIHNEILNLSRLAYDFEDIMDLFSGKNIIIVSAGPSLEKNIHLLEEAKKKAIVVAVGSAIRILDARGIIPHFRMALDPLPAEYAIFRKLKETPVPLIYCNGLYAEILVGYKGLSVCTNAATDMLGLFLHKRRKGKTISFGGGPSVANMAANTFCALGCKRMVFIGQDMCMYNHQLHADTGESVYKDMQDDKTMIPLKDIYGNDVVSPRNYYMIKEGLENTVVRYDGKVDFINATEGGLGIRGVSNKPLADVLPELEDDDIAPVIEEYFKKSEMVDFQEELYDFKEKIGDIDRLNDKNLENLQKIKDIFLKDEHLRKREKYVKAVKEAQKNEKEMKKIDWHSEFIQSYLELFLEMDCVQWQKNIESPDEKKRLRSIIEIQLFTARSTKKFTIIFKRALEQVFSEEIKTKTFSLTVK